MNDMEHSSGALGFKVPTGYAPVPGGFAPLVDSNNLEGTAPPQPDQLNYPEGQQPIITSQPGGWMSMPQGMSDCPSGLEYLAFVDKLSVYQEKEGTGFKLIRDNFKYTIQNGLGEMVYMALEDSNWCTRECECCPTCAFEMKIMDSVGNEVIHLNRPFKCECCCCPFGLQVIEVSLPSGALLGTVKQNWSMCYPNFSINNEAGETVLKIKGPCIKAGDFKLDITTSDEIQTIGSISKLSRGLGAQFAFFDGIGLAIPMNLDAKMKAVCLGALFLLKTMYFEVAPIDRFNLH